MRNSYVRMFAAMAVLFSLSLTAIAQSKGFDPNRMDTSVEACDDFFQYSNGTWIENTTIPGSESRWGSFNILAENNRTILKDVLDKASAEKAVKGTDMQLIGDFYYSCMNENAIEQAGYEPVKPILNKISKIRSKESLQSIVAEMHGMGIPALFGFGGGTDLKNSKMVIANAGQGGLSMPNRDYYDSGDAKFQKTRDMFREYMMKVFMLVGDDAQTARDNAFTVMRIQNKLAQGSLRSVELRNPDNRYNKMSLADAESITPNFSWTNYMKNRGLVPVDSFNVGQPAFFKNMDQTISDVSVGEWKIYLKWMVLNDAAPTLSSDYVNANFDFYSRHLQGTKEQQPRWQRCVRATDGAIGEALGQEYVKVAFKPEAKARMNELIDNLFAAFRERLDGLEWMSDETKVQALAKLATFQRKTGYPDVLRGYKGLNIDRGSYADNTRAFRSTAD